MQKVSPWPKSIWVKGVLALLATVTIFVILAAISGVIGGRSDAGAVWLWSEVLRDVNVKFGVLLLVTLVGALPFAGMWLYARSRAMQAEWTVERQERLNQSALILLSHVANLVQQPDGHLRDAAMQRLLDDFLRVATPIVPGNYVTRATLLRPDEKKRLLVPWASYEMPSKSLRQMHFDIGKPLKTRGIAGQTYTDGKARMVHFSRQDNQWIPTVYRAEGGAWVADPATPYVVFDKVNRNLRYASFVTLRISGKQGQRLGVICLDSKDADAFRNPRMLEVLRTLTAYIAPAIYTYLGLKSANEPINRPVQATTVTTGNQPTPRDRRKRPPNRRRKPRKRGQPNEVRAISTSADSNATKEGDQVA